MEKICVLDEEKLCDDCGECVTCDLDPKKLCDNCMKCVNKSGVDYLAIEIDEVINATSPDGAGEFPARAPKIKAASPDSANEFSANKAATAKAAGAPKAEAAKAPAVRGIRVRKPRNAPS